MNLRKLPQRCMRRLATHLRMWTLEAEAGVAARTLPRFANQPKQLTIDLPRRLINPEFMYFGDHVWLGPGCFITAVKRYPGSSLRHPEGIHGTEVFSPKIRIGDRVTSSGQLIIGAAVRVEIEEDVLLSFNVTILDNLHGYQTPDQPYKYQPLQSIKPVVVKRGCWIGQNAVILPGANIGEMSIIGANSVVTKSIPDRCIAVGAPARIIKKWDERAQQWQPWSGENAEFRSASATATRRQ